MAARDKLDDAQHQQGDSKQVKALGKNDESIRLCDQPVGLLLQLRRGLLLLFSKDNHELGHVTRLVEGNDFMLVRAYGPVWRELLHHFQEPVCFRIHGR